MTDVQCSWLHSLCVQPLTEEPLNITFEGKKILLRIWLVTWAKVHFVAWSFFILTEKNRILDNSIIEFLQVRGREMHKNTLVSTYMSHFTKRAHFRFSKLKSTDVTVFKSLLNPRMTLHASAKMSFLLRTTHQVIFSLSRAHLWPASPTSLRHVKRARGPVAVLPH